MHKLLPFNNLMASMMPVSVLVENAVIIARWPALLM